MIQKSFEFYKPISNGNGYHRPTNKIKKERRRKARVRKLPGFMTIEEWQELVNYYAPDGNCLRCGENKKLVKDHVIPTTHEYSCNWVFNFQPLCRECNSKKGNISLTDYRPDFGLYPLYYIFDRDIGYIISMRYVFMPRNLGGLLFDEIVYLWHEDRIQINSGFADILRKLRHIKSDDPQEPMKQLEDAFESIIGWGYN